MDFVWYEKNKRRDKDNVAFGKKHILDAMQQSGMIPNDNNQFLLGFSDQFVYGEGDKVRVNIVVKKGEEENMIANEYQQKALRTASGYDPDSLLINGALGLSGESGEVADLVKKHMFQGHELIKEHVAKELGDICWYVAISAHAIGYDLDTVMQMNIEKLMKRYPNGFESGRSINRAE